MKRLPFHVLSSLILFVSLVLITQIRTVQAASGVYVKDEQIVFAPNTNHQLQVVEVVQFQNDTGVFQTVKLPLPVHYQSLRVNAQSVQSNSPDQSLRPHSTSKVVLTYSIPFNSGTNVGITFTVPYDVDQVQLYVPTGKLELSSPNLLATTHLETIGQTDFRVFTRLGIQAFEQFVINVSAYPVENLSEGQNSQPLIGESSTGENDTFQAVGNLVIAMLILIIGFVSIRTTEYKPSTKDDDEW